jgi:histone H3/H4
MTDVTPAPVATAEPAAAAASQSKELIDTGKSKKHARKWKRSTTMGREIAKVQREKEFTAPLKPILRQIRYNCDKLVNDYPMFPKRVMIAKGVAETLAYAACQHLVFRLRQAGKQASYSGNTARKTVTARDLQMYDMLEKTIDL